MEPESQKSSNKAIIGIIVIVLLVIAATGGVIALSNNGSKDNTATAPSPSLSVASTSSSSSSFKDGNYSATGTYESPGGEESIDVSVTLAGGTITNVSATPHANVDEAAQYQSQFLSGYKSQVVGKKITDVNLSRVAGSSLTSIGFNSAIDQIKQKAQS